MPAVYTGTDGGHYIGAHVVVTTLLYIYTKIQSPCAQEDTCIPEKDYDLVKESKYNFTEA